MRRKLCGQGWLQSWSMNMVNNMVNRRKPMRPKGAAKVIAEGRGSEDGAIVDRPDGHYWVAPDGIAEFGPFASRQAARADRDRFSEEAPNVALGHAIGASNVAQPSR